MCVLVYFPSVNKRGTRHMRSGDWNVVQHKANRLNYLLTRHETEQLAVCVFTYADKCKHTHKGKEFPHKELDWQREKVRANRDEMASILNGDQVFACINITPAILMSSVVNYMWDYSINCSPDFRMKQSCWLVNQKHQLMCVYNSIIMIEACCFL